MNIQGVGTVKNSAKINTSKEKNEASFTDFLPKSNEAIKDAEYCPKKPMDKKIISASTEAGKPRIAVTEAKETNSLENVEDIKEEFAVFISNVKSDLMEKLNLSQEELENLMSVLGLTNLDLLQENKIQQIFLEATGEENPLNLVLSEEYSDFMKNYQSLVHKLEDTLDLDENTYDAIKMLMGKDSLDSTIKDVAQSKENVFYQAVEDETLEQVKHTDEFADEQVQITNFQETPKALVQDPGVKEIIVPGGQMKESVNVEDLMKQMDALGKMVTEDTETTIHMQLTPKHLGKVFLQISLQEGIITARIATEHEHVKELLINQSYELKEMLSAHGVRVNEVEVTTETHEFEQNLEQNFHFTEEDQGKQENNNASRNYTGDGYDENQSLPDEETLVEELMKQQGNRMFLQA